MKWLLVSINFQQEIYELWNNEEKLLTLVCQQGTGALRIATADEKRVFIIRKEGFLRSRTALRNEYGIRIGYLTHESNQDNWGIIDFNNEKFNYSIQKGVFPELVIYKHAEPVLICELSGNSAKKSGNSNHDSLVLVLSWYVFSSVAKKQIAEYA